MFCTLKAVGVDFGQRVGCEGGRGDNGGGVCIGCTQLQRGWNGGLRTIRGGGGGSFGGTAT